jgi:hypothetical protein
MKSELEVVVGFIVVPENPTIVLSIGAVQNDPAVGRIHREYWLGGTATPYRDTGARALLFLTAARNNIFAFQLSTPPLCNPRITEPHPNVKRLTSSTTSFAPVPSLPALPKAYFPFLKLGCSPF